jgi:drug/metabolite transporter (DMT)-like permease
MESRTARIFYFTLLTAGVFACSTSIILIKASTVHPAVLAAWRLLLATAILAPFFFAAWRRERAHFSWRDLRHSFLPALFLALHFISWAYGARMTLAANATLIVNMVPLAMPFFLYFLTREGVNRAEIAGTILGLIGVGVLTWGDYRFEPANLRGDFVCFGSMLLFALYLAFGRANRHARSLWLYLVPLYAMAGIICLVLAAPFTDPFPPMPWTEFRWLLGLAVIPTVLGHSLLNFSLKHISGQAVSVWNLGQFIFAGAMAYLFFGEIPHGGFYPAMILVVLGGVIVVYNMPRGDPAPVRVPAPPAKQ